MQEIDVEEVAGDFGVPTAKQVKPEECAEGTHQGRIVAAVKELKDSAFEKGAQYESLRLDVKILDEPTKPILKTWYTYSTTGIAPLLKILPPIREDRNLAPKDLIGQNAEVDVEHNETKKGTFVNISGKKIVRRLDGTQQERM